jgi:hypothetical protein
VLIDVKQGELLCVAANTCVAVMGFEHAQHSQVASMVLLRQQSVLHVPFNFERHNLCS